MIAYLLLGPALAVAAFAGSMAEAGFRERFARLERVEDASDPAEPVESDEQAVMP